MKNQFNHLPLNPPVKGIECNRSQAKKMIVTSYCYLWGAISLWIAL